MAFTDRLVDDPTATKTPPPVVTHDTVNILSALLGLDHNNAWAQMTLRELLELTQKPFMESVDLGVWTKTAGGVLTARYATTSEQVQVADVNANGDNMRNALRAIPAGRGLLLGPNIFVIEFTNEQTGRIEFDGFWAGGVEDPTAAGTGSSIKVINHELRMIRFMTAAQVRRLLPELATLVNKTGEITYDSTQTPTTVFGGALGAAALAQVQALIPASAVGLTDQEKQIIQTLQQKTADLLIETQAEWALATDAQFAAVASTAAPLGRLRSNQVPTGIASGAWTNDETTTDERVIVVRVPVDAQVADYRLLFGDNDPIRLDSYALYATGTQYAYYASTTLHLSKAGQIRLQYHGADVHTKYIGELAEDYVTEQEFQDYRPHTPDRGDTLPAHLLPQGTFVLQKTSHWSDKFYRFYPVWRNIDISGQSHRDIGTIEVPISSEWTVFESTDNPNPGIFSATRIAGMVYRQTSGPTTGYRWYPKVIMDRALFPEQSGAYDYSGLSIRMRTDFGSHFDTQLFQTTFDADDQTGSVTEIAAGGKTYVCFRPNPNAVDARIIFDNVVTNETWLSFQILKSKSASPVFPPTDPQFLSDDPTTAWVDGDEFETGLYEGDANGHPQLRILPSVDLWNHVVARSNTYFSGSGPDSRAGVDGQFWANLRNGQIHQKQSGRWTLITDLVLQNELQAAIDGIEASGGADGRVLFTDARPPDDVGKVGDVAIRRLSTGLGFYEKTGASTWAYKYEVIALQNRPTLNARDRLGLFWDGNTLGWSEQKAVFAELGINASITIPQEDGTAIPLTYASSLTEDHNATGIIARATAGNAITLKAGSYTIDVDMNVATATSGNSRSNIDFTLYNGNTMVKPKRGGYLRTLNAYNEQVANARFTQHFSSDATIQIRVKMHDNDAGDPAITTQAGGTVTVRRLGV